MKKTLTLSSFMKRCDDFRTTIGIQNNLNFNEYIEKKKIVVKLQETMNISKENVKHSKKSQNEQALRNSQSKLMKTSRTSY